MRQNTLLYPWVRGRTSILLGRITTVNVATTDSEQTTALDLHVEECLWGPQGAPTRKVKIVQPATEVGRMKHPLPVWGGIRLEVGRLVFLVTSEPGQGPDEFQYADEVSAQNDPVLLEVRQTLAEELGPKDGAARRRRYLTWLASPSRISRLFAATALAQDEGIPDVDPKGEIAVAYARAFETENDSFAQISIAEPMMSGIYPRANKTGHVAWINAMVKATASPSEGVRRTALDQLSSVAVADLNAPGIAKAPSAVPLVRERMAAETEPTARATLGRLISVISP